MAASTTPTEISAPEDRSPKRLGLSKLTYVLGSFAKDGWTWLIGVTVVMTGVLFFGRKWHVRGLETLAGLPRTVSTYVGNNKDQGLKNIEAGVTRIPWIGKWLGREMGALTEAFVVAGVMGAAAGWIGHLIGTARGPGEFDRAQKRFDQEVEANRDLTKANVLLEDENRALKEALAAAQATKAPHREQLHKEAEVVAAR